MSCASFYFGTRIKYEVHTQPSVYLHQACSSFTDYCSDNGILQKMCSVVLVLPHCVLCTPVSIVAHAPIFQALLFQLTYPLSTLCYSSGAF